MTEAGIPDVVRVAGIIVAAALAAAAVLAPRARLRAAAMLAALVVTPVLLVAEIWSSPQVAGVRERPALALAGLAAALVVVGVLAALMARRPAVLGVLAVAALPFRVPIESGGSTANLLVPLYVVIGAGALAWLVPRLRDVETFDPPRANGRLEWLLMGFVGLYAIQSAYSPDTAKALEQVVFFYVPFALLFALLRDLEWSPRLLKTCFGVLVALALVFAGIGFVEYQMRELLLNPKVISSNQFEEYFRVNSLFFDPNIYGRFLALVMLGLAGVLLWVRETRAVVAAAAALAVLWGGLLLTLSQSSFAALLGGLAVLAALRWSARWTVAAVAALAAVGLVLVVAFSGALRIDFGSTDSLDRATSGRYALMAGGIGLARERPLLGWGSGAFGHAYRRQERASSAQAVSASHTIPITVAAEQGIPGLVVYLALLAAALALLLRRARAWWPRAVIAACFVALVLHTWLYAAFLEDPITWTLLGIGVALARRPAPAAEGLPDAASENGHAAIAGGRPVPASAP
jgi:O-antigen ligase